MTGHEKFFSAVLVEKAVLLGLLSVIFAQVLPDIRATNLGLVIGVSVLVVSNSLVSQWLRRRGRSWSTTGAAFLAMLAINVSLVMVDALLLHRGDDGDFPALNTLFFTVLLSLLIAMYDRFRATRNEGEELRMVMAALHRERAEKDAVPA